MFKENPFTGACAYATYEVLVMLVGTFLLGLLLGYLIWGWLRRQVTVISKQAQKDRRIADLRQIQIVDLSTRIETIEAQLDRADTRVSVAEYKLRRTHEEMESLRDQVTSVEPKTPLSQSEEKQEHLDIRKGNIHVDTVSAEEPTLADISKAMERSTLSNTSSTPGDPSPPVLPLRELSAESLDAAQKIFGQSVDADDLKLIHGIDQKMEDILHRAGVVTWQDLAYASLPELRRIIEEAGPRYREHDPKTWSIQARMATREEWKKLKAYQETLQENE